MLYLRSLELQMSSQDLAFILGSMATPEDLQTLTITCSLDSHTAEKNLLIKLPADPRCLPSINKLRFLRFSHQQLMGSPVPFCSSMDLSFRLVFKSSSTAESRQAAAATLNLILKCYSLHCLQTVLLTIDGLSHEDIISVLSKCSSLTRLDITGRGDYQGLLKQLTPYLSHSPIPFCPALQTIAFYGWNSLMLPMLKRFCRAYFQNPDYTIPISERVPEVLKSHNDPCSVSLRQLVGANRLKEFICFHVTGDEIQKTALANVAWSRISSK